MAKRDEYLAHIRKQLSVFEVEVRQNNKVNRQGINISAEDILGGLLNLLHDWNLHNTNEGEQVCDLLHSEVKENKCYI